MHRIKKRKHELALKQRAPFAATAVLAWAAAPIGDMTDWRSYAVSVAVLIAAASFGLVAALRNHLQTATVGGSLLFLLALELLRDASGGLTTGVGLLSLLAVFDGALQLQSPRKLAIVLAGVAAFYLCPLLLIGGTEYPSYGYRSALIATVISCVIGFATQGLIADIRRRARDSRRRERMLLAVNNTVHRLFESPQVRADLCAAVRETCEASAALIYELPLDSVMLQCTASTFAIPDSVATKFARPESAVHAAFTGGEAILLDDVSGRRVGNEELWRASGKPRSILYQPLIRREARLGVLVVGWDELVHKEETRVVIASLLAHEGAAVIDRADVIDQLTDDAYTDALTGLPNRRAWDERIAWASGERRPLAIAIIDFDEFKTYNDTYGHPAGDALLRATAAVWRAELRSGDLLARIGGEEFGLLIGNTDPGEIEGFVDRLRNLTPGGQTCSAGIAFRERNESGLELVARADAALYEAKTGGRDRVLISG